jgi:exodeoxyribonuclease (lambda-induced)
MIIIDAPQRSAEWYAARCGVPSASSFDKIITVDGKPSKQAMKYLYQLAGERITGKAEESYVNGAMQRGIELEAEARQLYSIITDLPVQEVGFCVSEGWARYGASPDGIVDSEGLLEIKCPTLATHVCYLLDNALPSEYFQQKWNLDADLAKWQARAEETK